MAARFRTQQIRTTLGIVVAFLIVTLTMLSIGLQNSLEQWRAEHGVEFDSFLEDRLERLLGSGADVAPAMIGDYLTPYLDPTLYLIVFDGDGRLIFWTWKGDNWYWRSETPTRPDPEQAERQLIARIERDLDIDAGGTALVNQFRSQGVLHTVSDSQGVLGAFVAGSNGFTVNRTNRRLLGALSRSSAFGLGTALILVLLLAALRGRKVDTSIREITTAMNRIAAGSRNERLPAPNIAELKEISASATALQSELLRAEQLRRQWTMDVAHDLRTPVANLQAQIEAISDGLLEATPARLAGLGVHTQKLARLTDDLLMLCRVESPDYQPEFAEFPVRRIAQRIEAAFCARITGEGRELDVVATDELVTGDEELLERAVANLVENSLRHGTGTIRCRFSGSQIEIHNGGAIRAEIRDRLFDRMYRGSPERGGAGHGLGLSIAKAIADVHAGSLDVGNADGGVSAVITLNGDLGVQRSPQ